MIVKVWACPIPGCGNYYASSSSVGDGLDTQVTGHRGMNGESYPERGHSRAQCPDCRDRGVESERALIAVDIARPLLSATMARTGITASAECAACGARYSLEMGHVNCPSCRIELPKLAA